MNREIIIHIVGFVIIGAGLAYADVFIWNWQWWAVLTGVNIVYLNKS